MLNQKGGVESVDSRIVLDRVYFIGGSVEDGTGNREGTRFGH